MYRNDRGVSITSVMTTVTTAHLVSKGQSAMRDTSRGRKAERVQRLSAARRFAKICT